MPLTFIDTNRLPKKASTGHGEVVEVLNNALCGARNVHGSVRLLKSGETFEPEATGRHQLIYLMDGKGRIRLDNRDYDVEKGAGVYLGPAETAAIRAADGAPLKLFHLIVPQIPK
jgi:mannose-6-phosphate isomerase-like protein (cupin superfamily)